LVSKEAQLYALQDVKTSLWSLTHILLFVFPKNHKNCLENVLCPKTSDFW